MNSYFVLEDSNTAQQGSNFEDDVHDPDVVHPDKHIKGKLRLQQALSHLITCIISLKKQWKTWCMFNVVIAEKLPCKTELWSSVKNMVSLQQKDMLLRTVIIPKFWSLQ